MKYPTLRHTLSVRPFQTNVFALANKIENMCAKSLQSTHVTQDEIMNKRRMYLYYYIERILIQIEPTACVLKQE